MIVLEPDEKGDTSVLCAAVNASEDYYAMVAQQLMQSLFPCILMSVGNG